MNKEQSLDRSKGKIKNCFFYFTSECAIVNAYFRSSLSRAVTKRSLIGGTTINSCLPYHLKYFVTQNPYECKATNRTQNDKRFHNKPNQRCIPFLKYCKCRSQSFNTTNLTVIFYRSGKQIRSIRVRQVVCHETIVVWDAAMAYHNWPSHYGHASLCLHTGDVNSADDETFIIKTPSSELPKPRRPPIWAMKQKKIKKILDKLLLYLKMVILFDRMRQNMEIPSLLLFIATTGING